MAVEATGVVPERFRGSFAVLDYGAQPFVVGDLNHPFYGLNFAGTRAAHIKLNGFRTEFGFSGNEGGVGEDVDMFERAMRAGMRVVYTPDARVGHMIPRAGSGKATTAGGSGSPIPFTTATSTKCSPASHGSWVCRASSTRTWFAI